MIYYCLYFAWNNTNYQLQYKIISKDYIQILKQPFSESNGNFCNFLRPLLKVCLLIRSSLTSLAYNPSFRSLVNHSFFILLFWIKCIFLHYIMTIMNFIILIKTSFASLVRNHFLLVRYDIIFLYSE